MTCPDENTFARILTGGANAEERAEFHQHLDQCPECLQLISILGGLEESSAEPGAQWVPPVLPTAKDNDAPRVQQPLAWANPTATPRQNDLLISLVVMGLAQLASAILLLSSCHQFLARHPVAFGKSSIWFSIRSLWLASVEVLLVVGPVWALVVLFALVTKRRWMPFAAVTYAWVALPTLFWGPIAICILFQLRRYRMQTATR